MNPGPISANSVSQTSSLEHYLFEPRFAPYMASLLLFSCHLSPADSISRLSYPPWLSARFTQQKVQATHQKAARMASFFFPRPHLSFVPFSLYGFTSVQDVPPSRAPVLAGQPLFMALGIIFLLPSISPSSGAVAVSCVTRSPDASLDLWGLPYSSQCLQPPAHHTELPFLGGPAPTLTCTGAVWGEKTEGQG